MIWCEVPTSRRLPLACFCLLLPVLFLFAHSVRAQSDEGAPPPAHLPRFIFECEAGPGFSSCSLWTWHGSSYSAIWMNGETGQLTVVSGNAAELSVQRKDTAGGAAGLTATYTGKWDGTRFTDGKMTYAFKGASGAGVWTLTREVTPIVHTTLGTVQTVTQDEIYGVGRRPGMYYNWYTADLTGFAIHSNGMAGSGVTINLACPGTHATDRMKQLGGTGPMGDPADFGRVVAFLCSEPANYINGVAVQVDGGATLGLL